MRAPSGAIDRLNGRRPKPTPANTFRATQGCGAPASLSVLLKSIVTLTISARTGGRNDRIGNVLVEPIEDDVEDCEIVRAQHAHARGAIELAAERRIIQIHDGRRRDGMGRAGVDGVTDCISRRLYRGWWGTTHSIGAIVSVYDQ